MRKHTMIHSQSKSHLENIKTTYPQSRRLFVCFVCFVPFYENLEIKFLSNFPQIEGNKFNDLWHFFKTWQGRGFMVYGF
jgi:hypothetical protein